MAEFIKLGNSIVRKPAGADYDLVPGELYTLNYDRYEGRWIFNDTGHEIELPKKVYESVEDKRFKKRVLDYYQQTEQLTTGILLAGIKGTGKTVMAKCIARESGLPIIIPDQGLNLSRMTDFFKDFTSEVCIMLDEVEKNYDTEQLLPFLDGVQATVKKLVIMTSNSISKCSEYLIDRCSRVRYVRKYTADSNIQYISDIIEDMGLGEYSASLNEFMMKNIRLLSIDNIVGFLKEFKLFNDEFSMEEILLYMNISDKLEDINFESIEGSNRNVTCCGNSNGGDDRFAAKFRGAA
jgi:hypothetical protein